MSEFIFDNALFKILAFENGALRTKKSSRKLLFFS
jgi:hypothetical protein